MDNRITPYVGILVIYIEISWSRSLKDRRQVVRSVLEKVNHRWNISSIDLGPMNSISRVHLGFAALGTSSEMVRARLDSIVGYVQHLENASDFSLIDKWVEVDKYD